MTTVLVVDDEDCVRTLVRMNLTLDGFVVHEGRDGDEAVPLAVELRPDCVVLDRTMPGADGVDVCRALRAHPATRDCTIVFLSARTLAEGEATARPAGADGYVEKPFEPGELGARIRSAIASRGDLGKDPRVLSEK